MLATMVEKGNGFAAAEDYAPGDDGELYRITSIGAGRIQTGAPGEGDRIEGVEVELADWADVEEGEESPVLLILAGTCRLCGGEVEQGEAICNRCDG